MSDDDLTELILRASAYLDGELDAAETARAEADSGVMAEVEQLRALQADVRFVGPPTSAARESALTAALAEFDSLHAQAVPPTVHPSRVVPFGRRPAYTRWLTAAAAVVAVGVLGAVIANGTSGGDDEQAGDAAFEASAAPFDNDATARAEANAESAFTEEAATAEESAPAAEVFAEAPATIAATASAAESTTQTVADAGVDGSTMAPAAIPIFDEERPIVDEFELGAAGAELLAREAAGTLAATPETRCELDPYDELSFGQYQVAGDVREVLIAVDRSTLRTAAFDADTCGLVAESPAP